MPTPRVGELSYHAVGGGAHMADSAVADSAVAAAHMADCAVADSAVAAAHTAESAVADSNSPQPLFSPWIKPGPKAYTYLLFGFTLARAMS